MRRVAVVALLVLGACAPETADPAVVDDLRVLAVRADPPEAAPGDTVTLDALVADPVGDGRTIGYTWALCELTLGASVSDCSLDTAVVLSTDAVATVDVPSDALDGVPSEFGVDAYVLLIVDAEGETDEAIKRVRISSDPTNDNPLFESVTPDGDAPGSILLEAVSTSASLQTYELDGVTLTEEMRFSWLITEGELLRNVSYGADGIGDTEWTLESVPATLWVVLRDQRGGVDFTTLTF